MVDLFKAVPCDRVFLSAGDRTKLSMSLLHTTGTVCHPASHLGLLTINRLTD